MSASFCYTAVSSFPFSPFPSSAVFLSPSPQGWVEIYERTHAMGKNKQTQQQLHGAKVVEIVLPTKTKAHPSSGKPKQNKQQQQTHQRTHPKRPQVPYKHSPGVNWVINTVTHPGFGEPARFRNVCTAAPTAVNTFRNTFDQLNDGTYEDLSYVPAGQGWVAVSRNPFQSVAYPYNVPSSATVNYTMYGPIPILSGTGDWIRFELGSGMGFVHRQNDGETSGTTRYPLSYIFAISTTDTQPFGPRFYSAQLGGRCATFFGGSKVAGEAKLETYINASINYTGTPEAKLYSLLWNGTEWNEVQSDTFDPTISPNIYSSGWWAFELDLPNTADSGAYTVQMTVTFAGQIIVTRTIPQLEFNQDVACSLTSGAALLISPNAPELSRGGSIAISQPSEMRDISYLDEYSDGMFSQLSQFTTSANYIGDAVNGAYAYLKPSSLEDLELRPLFEDSQYDFKVAVNPALNNNWLVAAWTTPPFSGTYGGSNFRICATHNLEYRSISQWRMTAMPGLTSQDWITALEMISRFPQFSENPKHLDMIRGFLKASLRNLRIAGPAISTAASLLFPQHKGAITAIGALADRLASSFE